MSPMKDRPILFSGAMIRALRAGTKTQTRRAVKPQPDWLPEVHSTQRTDSTGDWINAAGDMLPRHQFFWPMAGAGHGHQCGAPLTKAPYGMRGDLLVVRETFRLPAEFDDVKPTLARPNSPVHYEADGRTAEGWGKTRVSIHMPRWASRLTLEITEVRVERLQDISEKDAVAEGLDLGTGEADGMWGVDDLTGRWFRPERAYQDLWDSINAKKAPWASNPWTWAVSFKVHHQNIDHFRSAG